MTQRSSNIIPQQGMITRAERERMLGQKAKVIWFTGLPGAGKSTLAYSLEARLFAQKKIVYVFDGDNIRHGLCKDLGFTRENRQENLRRIGEMLRLFVDSGIICLAAFIAPMHSDREMLREIVGKKDFIEVFVNCPLDICEKRDVKGHYKLAREGIVKNFTGISSPYEEPSSPDIEIRTDMTDIQESTDIIIDFIKNILK